jgi:hypothetical protein
MKGRDPHWISTQYCSEFKDVFPNELPRLPPERELDFTIELKPGAEPISKTLYRMTAPNFVNCKCS